MREVKRGGGGGTCRAYRAGDGTLLAAAAAHDARDEAHRRALAEREHLVVEPRHLVRSLSIEPRLGLGPGLRLGSGLRSGSGLGLGLVRVRVRGRT